MPADSVNGYSTSHANAWLLDARVNEHDDDKPLCCISALSVTTLESRQLHQFKLPWPQSSAKQNTPFHDGERIKNSISEPDCGALEKLLKDSYLIGFDISVLRNNYLLPLFAAHHIELPQFSGISFRDLAQRLFDPGAEACRSLEALSSFCGHARPDPQDPHAAINTMASLLTDVLLPRLEEREIIEWEQIAAFAASPWYPSRFVFGKYKGRHVQEASDDPELKAWLEGLSQSNNSQSAAMARWYLDQLSPAATAEPGLIPYISPEAEELQARIAAAREQLAELDAEYTEEHQAVAVVESQLFLLLRPSYEKRDQLQLRIDYRRRFLDALLREGEDEAAKVAEEHQQASQESQRAYEEAGREASDASNLNPEEQQELRSIYRRLAALYHPDRYAQDPARQSVYETLMKLINSARDAGWVERLREIARDANGFLISLGLTALDLHEDSELDKLQQLVEKLTAKIQEVQESLDQLRQSSGYELWQLSLKDPDFINRIAADQINDLQAEIAKLEAEADALAAEIEELTGTSDPFNAQATPS